MVNEPRPACAPCGFHCRVRKPGTAIFALSGMFLAGNAFFKAGLRPRTGRVLPSAYCLVQGMKLRPQRWRLPALCVLSSSRLRVDSAVSRVGAATIQGNTDWSATSARYRTRPPPPVVSDVSEAHAGNLSRSAQSETLARFGVRWVPVEQQRQPAGGHLSWVSSRRSTRRSVADCWPHAHRVRPSAPASPPRSQSG